MLLARAEANKAKPREKPVDLRVVINLNKLGRYGEEDDYY
jgi:hypothetical protein